MFLAAASPTLQDTIIIPVIMVAAVIAIGVLCTIGIRGRIARRQSQQPDPREVIRQIKTRAGSHAATTAATAEMAETARRLAAQLDNKAERLEQLLAETDVRLRQLRDALAAGSAAPVDPQDATPDETEPVAIDVMAGQSATSGPSGAPPRSPAPAPSLDPLTRNVYELADAGHDAVDIARRLDEQIGKVELILALRAH